MQHPDTIARCGHGPFDLVYLVWDRDADGIEFFNCARELPEDTIVDSTFIGTGIICPSCSTGAFSKDFNWTVTTGDYDTFYVIALNDTTLDLATYYGTTQGHTPSVWEVHTDSLAKRIDCTENGSWSTDSPFDEYATFSGSSITSGGLEPGAKKAGMVSITAWVPSGSILWTWVRVDNGPSAGCTNDSADIDSVKIYKEISVVGFDPADDSLIGESEWGPGPPDGGSATVTFFSPETLSTTAQTYYVAFDISVSAPRDHCVAACVQDSLYIGIPDYCRDGNFPFCSEDVGLPVEISRFEAFPGNREIMLEWTTQSEIDNKGFYIYRALSADGDFCKLNEEEIPGAGTSYLPIDYEYVDRGLENGKEYYYKLASVSYGNALSVYEGVASAVPSKGNWRNTLGAGVFGSSPNPFFACTSIAYGISNPESSVSLGVYDISGRRVRALFEGEAQTGIHTVEWDGKNDSGSPVSSGFYFCRLQNGSTVSTLKLVKIN